MVYKMMKGAFFMQAFLSGRFFMPLSLITFITENILLLIILGLVLLFIFFIVFRIRKKKKGRDSIITPVRDVIGNVPERVLRLNEEIKPLGFAYDPDQDIFYSILNPWQRKFGYCRLYDEACAPLSMIIDCEPITFEYAGRKWLIEFWKGQYGMNTGAEVGIYYSKLPAINVPGIFSGNFYFCPKDDECINMSFTLRKNGNLLFSRSGHHWWLTGFKLGEYSKPSELSMEIILELYDYKMAMAFVEALKKEGYTEHEYKIQANKVMVIYDKPHTRQPLTRTVFTDYIMQRNNESLCNTYNYLTRSYTDTLDKLDVLRNENSFMYNKVLALGKPREVFEAFNKIKDFLGSN